MSERFGIPDHSPQHAPDHAAQNPTAQGSWGQPAGAADAGWPPSQAPSGGAANVRYTPMSFAPTRRSLVTAVVLAMVLGPLGLFYAGFLHGLVALFVVVPITRWLAFVVVAGLGGGIEPLTVVVPIMWCITVPWAIVGTRRRNQKLGL
jgi:hypothetical protein